MKEVNQPIFSPYHLPSGVSLNNRIMMAPMTIASSGSNGEVTEEELNYYGTRAQGLGAVITSSALVSANGKMTPNGFAIDGDHLLPGLKQLATAIQTSGTKAIVQLYHGGRLSPSALVPEGRVIAPSAIAAARPGSPLPQAMTDEDINNVLDDFAEAVRRAIEAGFDGVEIHGANGFLLQQFFSPHANRREDQWGGTLAKRMAFPLEVIRRVKATVAAYATSPFAVGYRISPEENEKPGITMQDTLQFLDVLAEQNLDYIHVSVDRFWAGPRGGSDSATSRIVMIQNHVGERVPVIGVGGLYTPEDILAALNTGVPLVALGHAMILNPNWAELVQGGQENRIKTVISRSAQAELAIPDGLWAMIMNVPGWFQVVD
ncbi:NADH-dependent flavin oxidoreductase [Paenibacillus senegalimassiliensis]|uniref:NADH-dependent flavin oxidoreductase n=1 Tax=Paenibacillus senegalimassiliensis TaxID=1737426 RepID=UPI00073E1D59|nr:NADH-dependent flavin oxidoreductase [Paenibacillus senegalimassiliensis]